MLCTFETGLLPAVTFVSEALAFTAAATGVLTGSAALRDWVAFEIAGLA